MSLQRPAYLHRFDNVRNTGELMYLSRDGNGRVREETLRRLAALSDTAALPALLEGVNDWVAPIRDRARRSVLDLATTVNAAAFVQQLPEIDRLRRRSREDHSEFLAELQRYFVGNGRAAVLAGLRDPDFRVAQCCLELAAGAGLAAPEELAELALASPNSAQRRKALALIATLDGEPRRRLLRQAATAALPALRSAALRQLLADADDTVDAHALLFDAHRAVRVMAAGHLRTQGVDVAELYRHALDTSAVRRRRTALWGIARYGDAQDEARLHDCLTDPEPALRRDALNYCAHRGGIAVQPLLLTALADPALPVARTAAVLARRVRADFRTAELLPLLDRQDLSPALLCLAQRYADRWERLLFLLTALARRPDFAAEAQLRLTQWERQSGNSFVDASPAQREALRQVLDEHPAIVQMLRRQAGVAFVLVSSGLLPSCVEDAANAAATARPSFWQRLRRSWSAF
ncbi:HEAT repeat domain-containing protein [Tahibacter sp. UC22_41]|uniref:HEAT repeat domain-containing protein n=1 Tax=Tahibacter sp. UC22_41 TaxID=3350178 RepID=UPI0036DF74EE